MEGKRGQLNIEEQYRAPMGKRNWYGTAYDSAHAALKEGEAIHLELETAFYAVDPEWELHVEELRRINAGHCREIESR